MDVREAELPILVGLVDPFEKTLALLFLRKVEKYLDDMRAVEVQMGLEVFDRAVSLLPHSLFFAQLFLQALVPKNLRMHTDDQYLFIIRTVEDANSPSLWKAARRAQEEIVF